MTCFSIYLSGRQGADPNHLAAVGLQSLQADRSPEFLDVVANGPDGGQGLLAIWRDHAHPKNDPILGVNKNRQKWSPVAPAEGRPKGSVWIGHEPDRPPTPSCLRRSTKLQTGRNVELLDGGWWTIPEVFALPHILGVDEETGEFRRFCSDEFLELSEKASGYAATICTQIGAIEQLRAAKPDVPLDDVKVDFELKDAWTYACEALAVNYRVSPEVATHLRLIDEPRVVSIVSATIGLQDILETIDQKKTDSTVGIPVGSSTEFGG